MPRGKHLASKTRTGRTSSAKLGLILGLLLTLAVPAAAISGTIGNPPVDGTNTDGWANFTVVDTNHPAAFDGYFESVTFYAGRTGTINFVVVDANLEVTWVSENITVSALGLQTVTLAAPAGITAGANLGYYTQGQGVVEYDDDGTDALWEPNNSGKPGVADTFDDVAQNYSNDNRIYSMNAKVIATSPDICKKGGWEAYGYKNQGQCIASIVANDNAEPHAGD